MFLSKAYMHSINKDPNCKTMNINNQYSKLHEDRRNSNSSSNESSEENEGDGGKKKEIKWERERDKHILTYAVKRVASQRVNYVSKIWPARGTHTHTHCARLFVWPEQKNHLRHNKYLYAYISIKIIRLGAFFPILPLKIIFVFDFWNKYQLTFICTCDGVCIYVNWMSDCVRMVEFSFFFFFFEAGHSIRN